MMSENTSIHFENAIQKALSEFNLRLEQQRLFQIQTTLLKKLQEEIKLIKYCHSEQIKDLSLGYETFYQRLNGSGRSYENIINEKKLVDAYSAFEKFLFDCFCAIYTFFPKHLGSQISVNTLDLFMSDNIALCKQNSVEIRVQELIQAKNIIDILAEFNKKFSIKTTISDEERFILCEISLIRNLVIHNNGIVNRTYEEQVKKLLKHHVLKYKFKRDDTVFDKLEDIAQEIVGTSSQICEKIADDILNDVNRLEKHHENMS